jgi:hypothetical protein
LHLPCPLRVTCTAVGCAGSGHSCCLRPGVSIGSSIEGFFTPAGSLALQFYICFYYERRRASANLGNRRGENGRGRSDSGLAWRAVGVSVPLHCSHSAPLSSLAMFRGRDLLRDGMAFPMNRCGGRCGRQIPLPAKERNGRWALRKVTTNCWQTTRNDLAIFCAPPLQAATCYLRFELQPAPATTTTLYIPTRVGYGGWQPPTPSDGDVAG